MRNSIITELEFKDGIYQGQTLQSRYKQGLGVYVWENGSAYYGEWKSDQIDGVGILFLPPRTTIQGHFTLGKLNGSCVIQTRIGRYYGKWLNGLPDGPMTSLLKDGEVTITFQDGKPCRGLSSREFTCEVPQLKSIQCYGSSAIQVLELSSGTFYGITGKDSANKTTPNGLGVFVPIEGLFTCGQYKNGSLCGLGRLQQSSGEIYSGFFESGKFHGKGIYLFKEDELKWAKGLWRFGELIEIYQSGLVRDCQSPKDLLFPYSDHKNPITIKQPINLNNIKELEDLFESQFARQEPICNQVVTTPERKSKQSSHKYFQNTLSTSYKRISEALMGKPQEVKSPQPHKLIQYYKKQLQEVDLNEQREQKSVTKPSVQKKSVQKSLSNSNFIKQPRDTNKSSNKSISSSAYVDEIKKLQTQFTKPFDQNKSIQSHQSQIYQTIIDQDQQSQRSDLFIEKKPQESPIDQIIQRSQQYQEQQRKSVLDQSRQSQQSKQSNHPQTKSRCKSTEGRKQQKGEQIKTKSEGNKIKYQEQTSQSQLPSSSARKSLNQERDSQPQQFQEFRETSQLARESQQFRESIKNQEQKRDSLPKDTKRSQGSSISQQVSQRISVKSNLVNQTTPQKQDDHEKKLSFCQQDFAQEMRGTAIFNQSDSQNKFHRHKRSQSQTDLEKIADEDTQMQLVRQQQQYMQQLIEQQKRQLEELRLQQQQLEEEHASKDHHHKPGQVSVDSLDSYPQQSESFHQDFIRSVSEVLKSELRRKQEEDSMRDYQNHSPHFEQSKITNNQQSMFFNDQQSLENVNVHEKQRVISQQEDANRSRADSSMIKKQPVSHSELDELQFEKHQDAQSRQSRYSRAQSQSSQRNTLSVKQQHSFHQSIPEQIQKISKLPSQESIKKQDIRVQRSESILSQQDTKRKNDSVAQEQEQDQSKQIDQKQEQEESIQRNQPISRQSQKIIPQQDISQQSDQFFVEQKSKKHTDQKSVDLSQLSKMLEKQENPQLTEQQSKLPSQQSLAQQVRPSEQKKQAQKVQQSTVKKELNDSEQSIEQHFKSHKQSKQPSQTQLRYVPSPSQQLLPYQVFQSDKQMQIQPDQQSENIQVTIMEDPLDTKQNIQDIKLQLAAQREILSQLYNSIQESRQLKVSQFESEKRESEQRTVKRCMIPSIDPCSSPIKKVIITKGAFPAFTIIKSLSPIRM